ncbi:GntR family transcriptional regulator [Bordetella bronchiseptica]|uniref:FCD domain protein n=2 Tax=Bordetella bronchiseptica TaxID=518 RepID=A0ABR4RJQ1_BORBO|nr:GntR family transcriptional regulator [Bordetella bronchiseptica]SHQ18145.1 transcriptional regulator [Mycobacteroides abscessus subsp. abscessus]AWP73248.1 GntR family transcriptional regulator [Bordetella bronchiseptica]AWP82879.1 GntR family transcriptional regulator [Bordetella bronchiseptica]AWQ08447.1 GntR family transcriptional regulator [Bordetella bronchiseptica]AXT91169.1 GntR family transcriptional regulator [Bordetella bronchiseptica]
MTTTMYKTTTEPAEKGRRAFSQVLEKLREMVISYEIKPGERLNEVALAERLGVSRTPVREALHFLARDGFLAEAGRGYVRRPLNLKEMIDLYETREVLEVACLQLAAERATPQRLDALEAFLAESRAKSPDLPVTELVSLDETFHHMLAEMSGNHELQRILHNVNERIRFIRWINMERIGRDKTQAEHAAILAALRAGDIATAQQNLRSHISKRTEQIKECIAQGLARIYLDDDETSPGA